jgi:CRISPR-associated endonuclease/helicase Cas3
MTMTHRRARAHKDGLAGKDHWLVDHLCDVARRTEKMAQQACPGDQDFAALAAWSGWLHDLGKIREEFQDYLDDLREKSLESQHAVYGAAWAYVNKVPLSVVLTVMGHHAGLHDLSSLKDRLKDPQVDPCGLAQTLMSRLREEPGFDPAALPQPVKESVRIVRGQIRATPAQELSTRMLFSCLVDADRLDTERFMTGRERISQPLDARALLERLEAHVAKLKGVSSPVNDVRRELYAACVAGAENPPGCYSLTAPTGSGKTLAAMAFALRHAERHGLRRVIVVLPFLSIIEQNARVYRKALSIPGADDPVLEHHSAVSGLDEPESGPDSSEDQNAEQVRARQATENWDAPVIVTTAVQFLESLFSRRTSRCRKLHNIARSVVIFDEVQTLPFPLLDPILSAIRDLHSQFGASFLLGSATQPALESSPNLPSGFKPGECVPLLREPGKTFATLQRASLQLPFLQGEKWSWRDLAEKIKNEPRALIIVNLRKHAQELFNYLKNTRSNGLFHLSSTMCSAHREQVLGKKDDPQPGSIHHALSRGLDCIVVSTQVVEAGVDLDFPVVYRAISPLDAIIQAAGRCDREGLLTRSMGRPAGRVIVFEPAAEPATPPGFYSEATDRARLLLSELAGQPDTVLNEPDVFMRYYRTLLAWGAGRSTGQAIQEDRQGLRFEEVAKKFRIIDDVGQGVVVRYNDEVKAFLETIRKRCHVTLDDRRKLQRYTVSLYPKWIDNLRRDLRGILGAEDQFLEYVGVYDKDLGVPLGELPPETYLVG